jgi:hypothetical protein
MPHGRSLFKNFYMSTKIIYVFLLLGLGFSCVKSKPDDKKDEDKTLPVPTGTLLFHLHTYIENNEADGYNIVYTTDAGRQISLSIAQMYISDIQVVKLDGSVFTLPDTILLKTLETETYTAGKVPVGNYKGIRFKVGLSALNDALNPLSSKDSSALNHPEMWFGNSAQPDGYVFMNVQGSIDTTSDLSGSMQPFSYKIGSAANYIQVNLPEQNFTILENQAEYGHLLIDYSLLFSGIKLNEAANLSVVKADNNSALAQKITANIPLMFKYE